MNFYLFLIGSILHHTVQAAKPTQFFECVVQDFPSSTKSADFTKSTNGCSQWTSKAVVTNGVLNSLDQNNLPQYDTATNAFTDKATFDQWFAPSSDTMAVPTTVQLIKVGTMWQFASQSFFPTSGQGHDDGSSTNSKNFFTMRCETEFVYNGGETVLWRGNDDFWLFVNGKLIIDAGGVHKPEKALQTISLDSLNLNITKGCRVDVRFFFAERCLQSGSNFQIQTTMEPVRPGEVSGKVCNVNSLVSAGIGSVGNGGASIASNDTSAIEQKNQERLLQIGIILGGVFGFFVLWFLILFIVWLCRREHIKEQRLMHRMGGGGSGAGGAGAKNSSGKKKKGKNKPAVGREVEMGKRGGGGHARQETYAGWSKNIDPNTGRTYYQNRMTGESRWADDLAPDNGLTNVINPQHARTMTKEEKDLKFWGWQEHMDKATGVPFYHNSQTGETAWEKPTR